MPRQNDNATFISHLAEMRRRLIHSLAAIALCSAAALFFSKKIYYFLEIPLLKILPPGSHFITTTPFEAYMAYFKVALFAGFLLSTPVLFYHFWRFLAPALTKEEKNIILPMSLTSAAFFVGGALFGYYLVFPAGFYYVNVVLHDTGIQLMPRMEDYLALAITMLVAFGLCFELPLVIVLLGRVGLIRYKHIQQWRRYIVIVALIVAGVLTPGPDIISQCALAVPLWLLYELGGLFLWVKERQ